MPHIHDAIDFTVAAYIVHADKVLLVHHKQLDKWLPVGGHIELNEDPEQALYREIEEETGLTRGQIAVLSEKPARLSDTTEFLLTPRYLDIHRISDSHRHIGMVYIVQSKTVKVRLAIEEHREARWFDQNELHFDEFGFLPEVRWYAEQALKMGEHEESFMKYSHGAQTVLE